MKLPLRSYPKFTALALAVLSCAVFQAVSCAETPVLPVEATEAAPVAARISGFPLQFEPDRGQLPGGFDAMTRGAGYTLGIQRDGFTLATRPGVTPREARTGTARDTERKRRAAAEAQPAPLTFRLRLAGANGSPAAARFDDELTGKINDLRGNDPKRWVVGIPTFARVSYAGVYPGIDLVYRGTQRQVEHDFRVAPGADPAVIEWSAEGVRRIEQTAEGDLVLQMDGGSFRLARPLAFQDGPQGRKEIAVRYAVEGTSIRFAIGDYDRDRALVIDPVLYYSTYLGGSDYDEAYAVAVDDLEHAYVTGVTYSTAFPLNTARQSVKGADADAFVSKLKTDGSGFVFSTYLGGNGYDEGTGIGFDSAHNVYVTGVTFSTDFPVANAAANTASGGGDAFLTKLDSAGSTLLYSTYLGGTGYDAANGLAVLSDGTATIVGITENPSHGDSDAFIARLTPVGGITFNEYFGGTGTDAAYAVALDKADNAYVTGETQSSDFLTYSAYDATYNGSSDAFVTKINPSGQVVYSTYLGGSREDRGNGIAVDSAGCAYVAGETFSTNFPTATPLQATASSGGDAFITKLSADGKTLVYSTYFGGKNKDYATAIAVGPDKSAHVTGYTNSADFPRLNSQQTAVSAGGDVFVVRLSSTGQSRIYSSVLGGNDTEYANGIAVDSTNVSILVGYTVSTNFPIYKPLDSTFNGVADAFVTRIGLPIVTITASDPNASEPGTDKGTFLLTRQGDPTLALTVGLTYSGTATPGADYTTLPASVTFAAKATTASLTVSPIDDTIYEGPETVIAKVVGSNTVTAGSPSSATVTIADNEVKPTVSISAIDASASEPGTDTGKFRVSRDVSFGGPLTVHLAITGTATNGTDYKTISNTIVIPAGSGSADIVVAPIDDTLVEGTETVVLTVQANAGYTVGSPAAATVNILDDDGGNVVTITADVPNANEAGTSPGKFVVSRTGSTAAALSVSYTLSGTATNGTDYEALPPTITIAAGSSTASVFVTGKQDTLVEGDETVVITLNTSSAYTVGNPKTATVTVQDDDGNGTTVKVVATDASAAETGSNPANPGEFTITRTGDLTQSLGVSYTVSGTATKGTDYSGLGSFVTIPANVASVVLPINVIDDLIIEGSETVIVTLVANSAYTIVSPSSATVTIADDDTVKPTVTVITLNANASETGPTTGSFRFSRSGGNTAVALTVNTTISGTATNGTDYNTLPSSVTIPVNQTSVDVTVTPIDDTAGESTETVIYTINSNSIYTIGSPSTATVNIADNDSMTKPTFTITATDATASEPGADTGSFRVSRTGNINSDVYANLTIGGTATNNTDYQHISDSVHFPSGVSSVDITVTPYDDLAIEGTETVILTLASDPSYTVGSPSKATVNILDDDSTAPTVTITTIDGQGSEVGDNPVVFRVTRTGGNMGVALTINLTEGGTATRGIDYSGLSDYVNIPANTSSVDITGTIYNDLEIEGTETVTVTVAPDTNGLYTVGSPSTASATIADDDTTNATVTLAVIDGSASEAGTDPGTLRVTRTGANTDVALLVNLTIGGTATRGSDYTGVNDYVNIPAGSTSADITVTPYDDLEVEGSETVVVTLAPGNYYNVGAQKTGTVTIADDDFTKPTITIVANDPDAAEPGATVNNGQFTVTRSGGTNNNVALLVSLNIGGTATRGYDYTGVSDYVNIPAGSASATMDVIPYSDNESEPAETVTAAIATDPNSIYNIGNPSSATVTIQAN